MYVKKVVGSSVSYRSRKEIVIIGWYIAQLFCVFTITPKVDLWSTLSEESCQWEQNKRLPLSIIKSTVLHLSIQGTMKNMPGPLAPPFLRRPSRKITALSYSFTTWSRWQVSLSWNSWRSFRRANIPTFTFTLTQKIKLSGSVARQQSTCGR